MKQLVNALVLVYGAKNLGNDVTPWGWWILVFLEVNLLGAEVLLLYTLKMLDWTGHWP